MPMESNMKWYLQKPCEDELAAQWEDKGRRKT
jgi:hypothetical protein